MFKSILVPYDGSPHAEQALDRALEMARLTDASLTILVVYRHHSMLEASLSMVRPSDPGNLDDVMSDYATEIAEYAKKYVTDAGFEKVRAFVKSGPTARTIVRFAKDHGHDLIVIGSRGMGAMESYLLGSVALKVTGLSEVPVLVV